MKKGLFILLFPSMAIVCHPDFWRIQQKAPCRYQSPRATSRKPNIIVIMADDLGFSDIGCYGGEIHTPNIDFLANNGIRYTQFYNTSRCCPTRASLAHRFV
jgi:membrane-anchored protein YejM (alkaline phosphatase superfamily)